MSSEPAQWLSCPRRRGWGRRVLYPPRVGDHTDARIDGSGRAYRIPDLRHIRYNEMAPGANADVLMIGLLVSTIGACTGYLEAWAIDPARGFGLRLFVFVAGWGKSAWPAPGNYGWIPVVGPLIGGVLGGAAYQWLIYPFLPARRKALYELRAAADAEASRRRAA